MFHQINSENYVPKFSYPKDSLFPQHELVYALVSLFMQTLVYLDASETASIKGTEILPLKSCYLSD